MQTFMDRHAPIFALKHELGQASNSCDSTVAQKREMREICAMNADEQGREERRQILKEFYEQNKSKGLKSVNHWAKRSDLGEATLRQLIDGTRPKNMRADTYAKLARGATELLGREVRLGELIGMAAELDDRAARLLSRLTLDQLAKAVAFLESLAPPER